MPLGAHRTTAVALLTAAALALAACSSGAGTSVPSPSDPASDSPSAVVTHPPADVAAMIASEEKFLVSLSKPDGVVPTRPTPDDQGHYRVMPYFSNLALTGLLERPGHTAQVKAWIGWVLAHVNMPDAQGMHGTVYDYTIADGVEKADLDYDSVDSYSATFITLLLTYWRNGGDHSYVLAHRKQISDIAHVMLLSQDVDHLSWAKPNYPVKYLMDNSELYRGLADAAALWKLAWPSDVAGAKGWTEQAALTKAALMKELKHGDHWYVEMDQWGKPGEPDLTRWYADATSQMYPVIFGVVAPTDPMAVTAWKNLNTHFPHWAELDTGDDYPWAVIGWAAAVMGDRPLAERFNAAVNDKFASKGNPELWYSLEAGMTLRMNLWLAKNS